METGRASIECYVVIPVRRHGLRTAVDTIAVIVRVATTAGW